ncbi:MAG: acyl-phosphate glycerol 3-phosphate acyltransferase [Flavobacteriales bacterium TMED123]|nr:MAG: acyl-phosphate glycerol 3-phosphate acyltransferase [Flavobacteriales bacterium TMED123]
MLTAENIIFLLIAYLIGAFPSAVWLGRTFYNTDVREFGSGNAGATNTFRTLGPKAGIPVLLMDIIKGWIAVSLVCLITDYQLMSDERLFELKLVFGIAAVIGHLFPVYTGFRGGKGIATMLGFMVGIYWQAAVVSAIVFVLTFLSSKYVSLSSIIASVAFPFIVFLLPYQQIISHQNANSSLILFSIFVPIISLITHQKNIERLLRREENKAKFGKK